MGRPSGGRLRKGGQKGARIRTKSRKALAESSGWGQVPVRPAADDSTRRCTEFVTPQIGLPGDWEDLMKVLNALPNRSDAVWQLMRFSRTAPPSVGEAMLMLFAPPPTVTGPNWMAVDCGYRLPAVDRPRGAEPHYGARPDCRRRVCQAGQGGRQSLTIRAWGDHQSPRGLWTCHERPDPIRPFADPCHSWAFAPTRVDGANWKAFAQRIGSESRPKCRSPFSWRPSLA